jgi:flavin-binding protein dodecin
MMAVLGSEEVAMAVARVTKITAASPRGFQEAVNEGLARAASTLHGITGLEVVSFKAKVDDGQISEYRVTIEVTFVLD